MGFPKKIFRRVQIMDENKQKVINWIKTWVYLFTMFSFVAKVTGFPVVTLDIFVTRLQLIFFLH